MTPRVYWLIWIITILGLITVVLLKGCCVSSCETMLAECERGLEEMAMILDEYGACQ